MNETDNWTAQKLFESMVDMQKSRKYLKDRPEKSKPANLKTEKW